MIWLLRAFLLLRLEIRQRLLLRNFILWDLRLSLEKLS
nr:MAG TPA: hypothetical protein [Caudoviricetes sp.]